MRPAEDPMDALLTTTQAAQAVHVSPHAVRKWRTRGWTASDGSRRKLEVVGYDAGGNPLHRYQDVLDAEMETRTSGKSFRRAAGTQDSLDLVA